MQAPIIPLIGMLPNLQQLAVFHAVATERGVTAAARRLGKSPPAVHHALKQFERAAGKPLFERVGRGLRLTAEGQIFHREVERALANIERATRRLESSTLDTLPLRVATVSGFGRFRLYPNLLSALPAGRPIEIAFGSQDDVIDALLRERVDYAVIYKPIVAVQISTERVADEELSLIAPAGLKFRSAKQAVSCGFITYDEYEYVFGRWFVDMLGRQPASLSRLDHTSELDEALTAVAAGRGITIAPHDAWKNGPWRARTQSVRFRGATCRNELYLASVGGGLQTDDARLIAAAASGRRR